MKLILDKDALQNMLDGYNAANPDAPIVLNDNAKQVLAVTVNTYVSEE